MRPAFSFKNRSSSWQIFSIVIPPSYSLSHPSSLRIPSEGQDSHATSKIARTLLHPLVLDRRVIGQDPRVMAVVPPAPSSTEFSLHVDRLQYKEKEKVIIGPSVLLGPNTPEHLLVVSPYEEESHLLDLRTVDTANQLLAKALVGLKCLRDDYATAPYIEIFNVRIPRGP